MSFDKRIFKVWKLCEVYNGAVLSVQFHMPGMPKKQNEIPLFIAAAIKKLLPGHWLYMRHMIELPTVINEYLPVAKEVQWDTEMSVKLMKGLKIYNSLQQYL